MNRLLRKLTMDHGPRTGKHPTVNRPSSIVRVGCPAHNCGGRCLLVAHIENGRITRLVS